MVVNEDIVTSSPRRIKLDAIARILEIGDMRIIIIIIRRRITLPIAKIAPYMQS